MEGSAPPRHEQSHDQSNERHGRSPPPARLDSIVSTVEFSSGKEITDIHPNISEIKECSGTGMMFTGPAPARSGYDFFTRYFCPKLGIDEDPVTGSAHCVLAPYWGGKLGKQKMTALQVSPRSGTLYLELEGASRSVRIQGEAVAVMTGTLLA